ncbi:hypothetical protein MMC31_003347 [Peltigera leucophlebia]|nr:hypothetical protein [Peltigera leucophlebia]
MDILTVAAERYVSSAHELGLTVSAIMKDLSVHGHEYATADTIGGILEDNGYRPKLTYPWFNSIADATKGLIPARTYPWNSWSSRFILSCKISNKTNSAIFTSMRNRGSNIPGEFWVGEVLDDHRFIENELARGRDTFEDAKLHELIVMAHNWGYTVTEITHRIFGSINRSANAVHTDMVKMVLEANGIPEAEHRIGKKLNVAEEFIISAYNLGMNVINISDRMYVHGFDHSVTKPIRDLLDRKGILQSPKLKRVRLSYGVQPTRSGARGGVRSGKGKIVLSSAHANLELSRRIRVRDLLN